MQTQRTGHEAPSPRSAARGMAMNAEAVDDDGEDPAMGRPSNPQSPGVDSEHRLESLEARLERLEMELEGLQDALYRHEVLQDTNNGELRRRTEQIARDLSRDARRRLL